MSETTRIENQLKRAFEGEAWHGPSVSEALAGVTAGIANARPIANAHTIWELVHHIGAWTDIVRRAIDGEQFEITDEVNFPPVAATTEEAWQASLKRLESSQQQLRKLVLELPESRLDEVPTGARSTIYVLLHGVAQHAIYHGAQIVLLRKIPTESLA
jgi:uncharacterized damage-inducible protein DinB